MVINGSQGEGGGALFRTALALSVLTQTPVRVHHIRGGTRRPGITSEDLTFVRMMESVCSPELDGDDLGSEELTFAPTHSPRPLRGVFDVQEHEKGQIPGNALMLAESALPVLARTGAYSVFGVHGETYNPNTLTFDAFSLATLKLHAKQGIVGFAAQAKAGFGFAGRGEVRFEIEPSAPHGLLWERRGELQRISGLVTHHGVAKDVPSRALESLHKQLSEWKVELELDESSVDSRESGVFITLVAEYERGLGTGCAMGARGVRTDVVCRSAVEHLGEYLRSEASLDPYLADQALLPAVLAGEPSVFTTQRITPRLQTMAWLTRQFIPIPVTILGRVNEPGTIKVGA